MYHPTPGSRVIKKKKRTTYTYTSRVDSPEVDPVEIEGEREFGELLEARSLYRNVQRFRNGLVFKAHILLHHSTLGL